MARNIISYEIIFKYIFLVVLSNLFKFLIHKLAISLLNINDILNFRDYA